LKIMLLFVGAGPGFRLPAAASGCRGVTRCHDVDNHQPRALAVMRAVAEDCGCDTPAGGVVVAGKAVTGDSLRGMELVDQRGNRATAGELIGTDGKAVVLFLRHLG